MPALVLDVLVDDVLSRLSHDQNGLVPVVAQQWDSGEVLMVAWMDDEALRRTLATGRATYWSRSRGRHWVKGETSGHTQHVREVRLDCDADTLLLKVEQVGPACHTGDRTCFDAGLVAHAPSDGDPSDGHPSGVDPSAGAPSDGHLSAPGRP